MTQDLAHDVRDWLAHNGASEFQIDNIRSLSGTERRAVEDRWTDRLREGGWLCVLWPSELGGRGLNRLEQSTVDKEFEAAGFRRTLLGMGEGLVGPSIIVHGTDEQKARFLPRILSGEDNWCQGFSEPDAGSDLAALATRGVVDGDELVITGQKVWTSGAREANWMFCLVRTDPDAPKHRGISYVLVPMHHNNIEIRPLRQLTGDAHFNEVFLNESRASLDDVVGGLHNGWRVSMTTLGNERSTGSNRHESFERMVWRLIDVARDKGRAQDPIIRQELTWAYSQVQIMKWTSLRNTASAIGDRDPGPSASIDKIFWTEFDQRLGELAMTILGPESMILDSTWPTKPVESDRWRQYRLDRWQREFLVARSHTIWGGTAQVQRNIVGERVLGLPKEPDMEVSK